MNIIALFAVDEEVVEMPNISTHITGVGKINAAYAATKIISEHYPNLVLNIGTAGTVRHGVGDVVVSNRFVDRDYYNKGIESNSGKLKIESQIIKELPSIVGGKEYYRKCTINTGDGFLTSECVSSCGDAYDMEAYAIASVCKKMGIEMLAIKVVTDIIGENSLKVWENRLGYARLKLSEYLAKYIIPILKND